MSDTHILPLLQKQAMDDKNHIAWCEYKAGEGRKVSLEVCAWHAERGDPVCRACEVMKRLSGGGNDPVDLARKEKS